MLRARLVETVVLAPPLPLAVKVSDPVATWVRVLPQTPVHDPATGGVDQSVQSTVAEVGALLPAPRVVPLMVTVSLALSVPAVTEVAIWVAMVGDTWLTEITSLARPGVGGVVLRAREGRAVHRVEPGVATR